MSWNPFTRDRTEGNRKIKVVFDRDGDVEEKIYDVAKARVKNGWLIIEQLAPERVDRVAEDGERSRGVEFKSRDVWLNKDFIVASQDPYYPGRSDLNIEEEPESLDLFGDTE